MYVSDTIAHIIYKFYIVYSKDCYVPMHVFSLIHFVALIQIVAVFL